MVKEISLIVTIALFIIAYAIDFFSGKVTLVARNPIVFLSSDTISRYPFTVLAIGIRTLGIFLSLILALTLMEKKYFSKAGISLFLAVVSDASESKGLLVPTDVKDKN